MDRRKASSLPYLRKRLVLKELEIAEIRLEKEEKNCCISSMPIMRNVLESNLFIRISDCSCLRCEIILLFFFCVGVDHNHDWLYIYSLQTTGEVNELLIVKAFTQSVKRLCGL
ncbi:hypothetical protein OESDEN_10872 [Oesophagostomum dentatum]|uniref:Uncharacterized protein n=1 Tax=Oesophagostomum dentatum TaxID=61180 RepID=A0A0B1T0L7_OESDE|nr:hypothetical protein OESDEN_10872 [Oesophagostomum dentatum]